MKNTSLCYIEKDGKYLMLHRVKKQDDANKDKWIGIGGKFEDKESPEECMLREVAEETGLNITNYVYRGIVTFVSNIYMRPNTCICLPLTNIPVQLQSVTKEHWNGLTNH